MNRQPTIETVARNQACSRGGFTLIELLASMAILGLIMVVLFSAFDQVNKAWLQGENRVETFTQARAILDLMSRELSQAIATPKITFYGHSNTVYFVAPVNSNPQNLADLCQVGYDFEQIDGSGKWTLRINRHLIEPSNANVFTTSIWNIYNPTWWNNFGPPNETPATLATNCIMNLQFQYFDQNGHVISPPYRSLKLPYAVVIGMDVVDSRTATRIGQFAPAALPVSITNATLRSFSTTIHFCNVTP